MFLQVTDMMQRVSWKQAIRYEEDPVIFMESEVSYGDKSDVPEEEYYIELGKQKLQGPARMLRSFLITK